MKQVEERDGRQLSSRGQPEDSARSAARVSLLFCVGAVACMNLEAYHFRPCGGADGLPRLSVAAGGKSVSVCATGEFVDNLGVSAPRES